MEIKTISQVSYKHRDTRYVLERGVDYIVTDRGDISLLKSFIPGDISVTYNVQRVFSPQKSRVIFLDIDGVIQPTRVIVANGLKTAHMGNYTRESFDAVALKMIRRLCEVADASVVFASTWVENPVSSEVIIRLGDAMDLPVSGFVDSEVPFSEKRGQMVKNWLGKYPSVKEYICLDDEVEHYMEEQLPRVIQVDADQGLSVKNMESMCELLSLHLTDLCKGNV